MLTVKERFEALCAEKTIVRNSVTFVCKYRLTEKRMERNLGGSWEYITMSEWLLDESEDKLWSIEPEYPLNIIQAYQEYKKGNTVSNDVRERKYGYGLTKCSFDCIQVEEIDANWRVIE